MGICTSADASDFELSVAKKLETLILFSRGIKMKIGLKWANKVIFDFDHAFVLWDVTPTAIWEEAYFLKVL